MIRRIYNEGELYLTRIYLLRFARFALYLHIFHKPDISRDLHNHPWSWCWTLPIWGGYVERLQCGRVTRYGGVPRKFWGCTYHEVERLLRTPTITLFAHGPVVREWSFLKDGEAIPWYRYLVDEGFNTQEEIDEIRERFKE